MGLAPSRHSLSAATARLSSLSTVQARRDTWKNISLSELTAAVARQRARNVPLFPTPLFTCGHIAAPQVLLRLHVTLARDPLIAPHPIQPHPTPPNLTPPVLSAVPRLSNYPSPYACCDKCQPSPPLHNMYLRSLFLFSPSRSMKFERKELATTIPQQHLQNHAATPQLPLCAPRRSAAAILQR